MYFTLLNTPRGRPAPGLSPSAPDATSALTHSPPAVTGGPAVEPTRHI
eukprot:CAMPEP_0180128908 /NCGR_PEP_ID=MMETSP0986-20121125/7028_1 /TAXON_ID=697907 /ORGANISM="non described non described, Strain CCMP2293" /LENGTH=47 /DNA_ID= /DNA_START= /DNA_END= /DNA_ORIENTATION=